MKIRIGFISNSSSSSFIIVSRKEIDELTKEEKMRVFNIDASSPVSWMADVIFQTIENKIHMVHDFEDWASNRYWGSTQSNPNWVQECLEEFEGAKEVKEFLDKGYHVYTGEFENNYENPIENYFSKHDLNFENEDLKIWHQGGY